MKKIWIVIVILAVIGGGYYLFSGAKGNDCMKMPAKEMNIGGHQNLALHIHPELRITIGEEPWIIPANIGVKQKIMRPIHTHDASGALHVEAPCPRAFRLGEFFEIWGETFNERCILDNCVDAEHSLKMFVNGKESSEFADLVLRDKDIIEIKYE